MEANRLNWDSRTPIHLVDETGFYGVDSFKAGADMLLPIEAGEIGDVRGKRLAHLQCHFGLDTMSLARRGARATGLDFSTEAIRAARALANELDIDATFVEGNVYDARRLLEGTFDIVFVTWGAINWLPDLKRWAATVSSLLAPGGFLYLAETHPSGLVLEEAEGRIEPRYDWRTPTDQPTSWDSETSYTGASQVMAHKRCYDWLHPLSDVIGAVIGSGLRLDFLHEHEALPWPLFPSLVLGSDRLYRVPEGKVKLPLAFSLKASKPG